jgi:hypothetical protein
MNSDELRAAVQKALHEGLRHQLLKFCIWLEEGEFGEGHEEEIVDKYLTEHPF